MQNNQFENTLRDRLEDHESELDIFANWDAVEAKLDEKKRRRAILIWWLLPLLFAGGIGTYWMSQPSAGLEKSAATSLVNTVSPASIIDDQEIGHRKEITLANVEAVPEQKSDDLANATSLTVASIATNDQVTSSIKFVAKPLALTDEPSQNVAATATKTGPKRSTSTQTVGSIIRLPTKLLQLPPYQQRLPLANDALGVEDSKIRKQLMSYWTIEAAQSISLPTRRSQLGSQEDERQQLARNDLFERNLEAFSSGLLIGFHTPWKVSFRTGLLYQRINTRLEVSRETEEIIVDPNGIIAISVDAAGDSTFTTGPVESIRTTRQLNRYHNTHTTFDVPLLVGYTFGQSKLRFHLEGGPVINISSISNARLYTEEGDFRNVSSSTGWFNKRIKASSWQIAGQLLYPITKSGQLSLGLRYFHYSKGGFEANQAGYQTSYSLYGVQLGYRLRF